jgi:hypothetical protein
VRQVRDALAADVYTELVDVFAICRLWYDVVGTTSAGQAKGISMRALLFLLLASLPLIAVAEEPRDLLRLISEPTAFQTLVNPQCSHCRDEAKRRSGELRDDDRVLCWIRGYSDGGAIPIRFFLNPYRVISDSYGVFVYDPDAGYARGFAPSYEFTFHGWRGGVMVMKHKDGTLFSCLTGKAFEGPRKGAQLEAVPTLVSNWGDWLERYPQAVAYHMFEKYQPVELPKAEHDSSRQSRSAVDPRLPADEMVLGVSHGDTVRAYRLSELRRKQLTIETVGDESWSILWNEPTQTATAYLSVAQPPDKQPGDSRRVTLDLDSENRAAPFVDRATNSHWDITGRAVDGELKGWTLKWLDGTQVKWFAWAAEYPQTLVRGK